MKMKLLITISLLVAALQVVPVGLSQGRRGGGGGDRMGSGAAMGNLSQEERQKFMNARRTAMQDPAVAAAREKLQQCSKDLHDAMDAAMLKADPSIKPILDKLPKPGERRGGQRGEPGEGD